jgi:hypothetical protein
MSSTRAPPSSSRSSRGDLGTADTPRCSSTWGSRRPRCRRGSARGHLGTVDTVRSREGDLVSRSELGRVPEHALSRESTHSSPHWLARKAWSSSRAPPPRHRRASKSRSPLRRRPRLPPRSRRQRPLCPRPRPPRLPATRALRAWCWCLRGASRWAATRGSTPARGTRFGSQSRSAPTGLR